MIQRLWLWSDWSPPCDAVCGIWAGSLEGLGPGVSRSCRGPGASGYHYRRYVVVEHALHLVDGFEPGASALGPEVLVDQGTVQPLDDAIGLRPFDLGGAVLDQLEQDEQSVGMAVGAAAELAAVVRQHHLDARVDNLEARQHFAVHWVGRRAF